MSPVTIIQKRKADLSTKIHQAVLQGTMTTLDPIVSKTVNPHLLRGLNYSEVAKTTTSTMWRGSE